MVTRARSSCVFESLEHRALLCGDLALVAAPIDGASMVRDCGGNIVAAGTFSGVRDFDSGPGTTQLDSAAGAGFVAKFNRQGKLLWAKQFGPASGIAVSAVDVDEIGNIVVGGAFAGSGDFNPGAGEFVLSEPGASNAYVLKLSRSGAFQWATQPGMVADAGGRYGMYGNSLAGVSVDLQGNVWAAGMLDGQADFGGAAGQLTSTNYRDIYAWKIASNGTSLWAGSIVSQGRYDRVNALTTDLRGNVYLAGMLSGSADVDPSAAVVTMRPPQWCGALVLKLGRNGTFQWADVVGGYQTECKQIAVDAPGAVYTLGHTYGDTQFDPVNNDELLTASLTEGTNFAWKINRSGESVWAKATAFTGQLAATFAGDLYIAGRFSGTVDFDPGAGLAERTADGNDVFICKLDRSGSFEKVWTSSTATGVTLTCWGARPVALISGSLDDFA